MDLTPLPFFDPRAEQGTGNERPLTPALPMLCRLQLDLAWGEGDWAVSRVGLRAAPHTPLDQHGFQLETKDLLCRFHSVLRPPLPVCDNAVCDEATR
jgi:hypothetical protein